MAAITAPIQQLLAYEPAVLKNLREHYSYSHRHVAEFYQDKPGHDLWLKDTWLWRDNTGFILVTQENGVAKHTRDLQEIGQKLEVPFSRSEPWLWSLRKNGYIWARRLDTERYEFNARQWVITVDLMSEHPNASVMLMEVKHPPQQEDEHRHVAEAMKAFAEARNIWTRPVKNAKLARHFKASHEDDALFAKLVAAGIWHDEEL